MLFTKDLVLSVYFTGELNRWRVDWIPSDGVGQKKRNIYGNEMIKKKIYNISKIGFYTLTSLEFFKSKSEDKKLYKLVNVTKTYKCMVGKSMVTFFKGRIICFTGIH